MANQAASMQTSGNCGLDILSPNVHSSFLPTGVLQNVGVQPSCACIQSDIASQNHVGYSVEGLMCKLAHRFHCHKLNVSDF